MFIVIVIFVIKSFLTSTPSSSLLVLIILVPHPFLLLLSNDVARKNICEGSISWRSNGFGRIFVHFYVFATGMDPFGVGTRRNHPLNAPMFLLLLLFLFKCHRLVESSRSNTNDTGPHINLTTPANNPVPLTSWLVALNSLDEYFSLLGPQQRRSSSLDRRISRLTRKHVHLALVYLLQLLYRHRQSTGHNYDGVCRNHVWHDGLLVSALGL